MDRGMCKDRTRRTLHESKEQEEQQDLVVFGTGIQLTVLGASLLGNGESSATLDCDSRTS